MAVRWIGILLFAGSAWAEVSVPQVLATKCLPCHSGDAAQAGFKAHTREDLLKGGKSGPAVVPGKGAGSLLVAKIRGERGLRMPPSGPPLDDATVAAVVKWIDDGAKFDAKVVSEKVAPLAPRNPPVPAGAEANPIDRFVNVKGRVVSDAVFARRAWFDVTGLPPTPEELRAFVDRKEEDKRARLVDDLLANRRAYAEHWISFWNDLLRNDEGVIYHGERKSITQWLLPALEKNMPYDDMVQALLDPPKKGGPEGFLVGVTWRGVVSASQSPPMQAAQNAAQIFLGANLKCAACHDSFINRWKLKDTYGLAAMFSKEPLELVRCDLPLGEKAEAKFPFPELKVKFDESPDSRRKAAARWFVHRENGRFARTLVNRYWKQLFGYGIVEPADDMDAEPWNQDLLDWLASDFAKNGYDLQHLLRRLMTSRAYQLEASGEGPFRGPRLRRLSAEQFSDALSAVSGDWRVNSPRTQSFASYAREWRLKSDPLSRALGRPIRDQVYTERNTTASTLQALELTNGPLLSKRLERAAGALLGELKPSPLNVFDSKTVRKGAMPVDVEIKGAREVYLLLEDVDTYDPARVVAAWKDVRLHGPDGVSEPLTYSAPVPSVVKVKVEGHTRLTASAEIDPKSNASDISPAVRWFVFTEEPNPDQLVRVQGEPPQARPPARAWTSAELTDRLYLHLLSRRPTEAEARVAREVLGGEKPSVAGVEDLLWALLMSPEFQYVH